MRWSCSCAVVVSVALTTVGCPGWFVQTIDHETGGDDDTVGSEDAGIESSGTSAAESSSESESDSGEYGGECAFAMCIDMIVECSSREFDAVPSPRCSSCDVWVQDCPEGEKCTAYDANGGSSWNANKCVPVDPAEGKPGEACQITQGGDGNDTCEEGAICWDVDADTMEGNCVSFCDGSPLAPICAADNVCAIFNDGVLPICLPTCDPLAVDCPNPDNLCIPHPSDEDFVCVLNASMGGGTYGTPCAQHTACNAGLFCAPAEELPGCADQFCCSEFCDINLPNSCAGMAEGQECIPWWEMGVAPMGLEHVGGCGVL